MSRSLIRRLQFCRSNSPHVSFANAFEIRLFQLNIKKPRSSLRVFCLDSIRKFSLLGSGSYLVSSRFSDLRSGLRFWFDFICDERRKSLKSSYYRCLIQFGFSKLGLTMPHSDGYIVEPSGRKSCPKVAHTWDNYACYGHADVWTRLIKD